MRRLNRIQKLSPSELADLLIEEHWETDYDYDYEENIVECGMTEYYRTPDGRKFCDYDNARSHTIHWLLQDENEVDNDE